MLKKKKRILGEAMEHSRARHVGPRRVFAHFSNEVATVSQADCQVDGVYR